MSVHAITDIERLYNDSNNMYNVTVKKIEKNLRDLEEGIRILKHWTGGDGNIQINRLVNAHNDLTKLRNVLTKMSDASSRVAVKYRDNHIAGGGAGKKLSPIATRIISEQLQKVALTDEDAVQFSDEEAKQARDIIEKVRQNLEKSIPEINDACDRVLKNWTSGPGRDEANKSSKEYIKIMSDYSSVFNEVINKLDQQTARYKE